MSKFREFFIQIPYLCESPNADRWSKLNAIQFDSEIAGGTIYDKSEADINDPANRLHTAFGFMAFECNYAKTLHCLRLAELIMLAHYKVSHGENHHDKRIHELWARVAEVEGDYPDVASIVTADAAAADGGW